MDRCKTEKQKTHIGQKIALNFKQFKVSLRNHWMLYLLITPFLLWYIFFMYKPMYGLQIGFKEYDILTGISESPFVGLQHFREFLKDEFFWRAFGNTIMISLYDLVFGFPAPILLALMLNEIKNVKFKKTVQTITYLPHFISIVVIAGLVTNFLAPSGLVNNMIEAFGSERNYFLIKPDYFRTIYTGMNIWKGIGFGAVVYIAALAGVDSQLYEAASIDGAGKFRQLLNVTLPSIRPTIIVMLILKIGQLLSVSYEAILLLYQPSTYETADIISTYVYRTGMVEGRYDFATAVGLTNSIIAFALVYISNKISKKYSETSIF